MEESNVPQNPAYEPLRRNGHCNMCGMCCKAIRLGKDYAYFKEQGELNIKNNPGFSEEALREYAYESDVVFIYYNWEPITEEEAFIINPQLKAWYQTEESQKYKDESYYYKCKQFDAESNKCMVNDKKPRVCADYPYYGGNISNNFCFYSSSCGYKADIEELEP